LKFRNNLSVPPLTALNIKAEVVESVYEVGSLKPSVMSRSDTSKSLSHKAGGFFYDGFEASSSLGRTSTQAPVVYKKPIHLLGANSSNIGLTIFAANVDVRVDGKMAGELLRATKKNPPSRLRYELIFVSFAVVKRILKMGSYSCSDGEGRI
jgi:hypothetical protein